MTKKGGKNLIFAAFSEIIILVLSFIVPKLFILHYGSEVNGLFSSATQLIQYIAVFEAGIGSVMIKELYGPLINKDAGAISLVYGTGKYYFKKIIPLYFIGVFSVSLVYCFFIDTAISKLTVFLIVFLSGMSNVLVFMFVSYKSCVIQADGNYYFIAIINLVIKSLNYISQIVAIYLDAGIVTIKLVGLIVTLIQVVIYNQYFNRKYKFIDKNVDPQLEMFSDRKYYMIHQIASLMFSCTDMVILSFVSGFISVSVYSMYNMVSNGITMVLNIIINSFLFILGQSYQKGKEVYCKVHDSFKMFYMIISYSMATTMNLLICQFMSFYVPNTDVSYEDSLLGLLFSVICMINAGRLVDNNLASFAGYAKETLSHVIIELIINITFSIILVNVLGIYGVLLGTIIAISVRSCLSFWFTEKRILERKLLNGYKYLIIDVLIFVAIISIFSYIDISICGWGDFIFYGILIFSSVLLAYLAVNFVFFKKEFKIIFEQFVSRK